MTTTCDTYRVPAPLTEGLVVMVPIATHYDDSRRIWWAVTDDALVFPGRVVAVFELAEGGHVVHVTDAETGMPGHFNVAPGHFVRAVY